MAVEIGSFRKYPSLLFHMVPCSSSQGSVGTVSDFCKVTYETWVLKSEIKCKWLPAAGGAPLVALCNLWPSLWLAGIDNEWRKTQCMPREVCVDVGKEFGAATNTFFKPPCVSVYRCGGCCNSEGLQCMNTSTGYLSKTVGVPASASAP